MSRRIPKIVKPSFAAESGLVETHHTLQRAQEEERHLLTCSHAQLQELESKRVSLIKKIVSAFLTSYRWTFCWMHKASMFLLQTFAAAAMFYSACCLLGHSFHSISLLPNGRLELWFGHRISVCLLGRPAPCTMRHVFLRVSGMAVCTNPCKFFGSLQTDPKENAQSIIDIFSTGKYSCCC